MNDHDRVPEDTASALLVEFQRLASPSPRRTEIGLAALEARIMALAPEQPPPSADPRWSRPRTAAVAAVVGLAAAAWLAVRLAIPSPTTTGEGAPSLDSASDLAARRSRSDTAPPPPAEIAATSTDPVPMPAATTADGPGPSTRPLAVPPRRDPTPAAEANTSLEAELALVVAARAEPSPTRSLALLERHAREFPDGALVREREVMRVERLCAMNRVAEARALAERFIARYRQDVLTEAMRETCGAP